MLASTSAFSELEVIVAMAVLSKNTAVVGDMSDSLARVIMEVVVVVGLVFVALVLPVLAIDTGVAGLTAGGESVHMLVW